MPTRRTRGNLYEYKNFLKATREHDHDDAVFFDRARFAKRNDIPPSSSSTSSTDSTLAGPTSSTSSSLTSSASESLPSTSSEASGSSNTVTAPASSAAGPSTGPAFPASTTLSSSSSSFISSNTNTISTSMTTMTITTTVPTMISSPSTTFSSSLVTTFTTTSTLAPSHTLGTGQLAVGDTPVCIGHGLDISTVGLLSTVIVPSAIGLIIWLIFAIVRPRFRQVYAVREWFPPQNLRPPPLRDSFWAFLFPHVPFVPSLPSEGNIRDHPGDLAQLPSDGQISQRVLWICFVIVLSWSVIGLAGALPLYIVNTPCLADSLPSGRFGGIYSALQDLSVLRLLQLLENGDVTTSNSLHIREIVNGKDLAHNARIRLIILTVFVLVLVMFPALIRLLRELTKLIKYRQAWIDVHCNGMELGWLSAKNAPGFVGWGEKRLKDFIMKTGLSASLDQNTGISASGNMAGIGSGFRGRSGGVRRTDTDRQSSNDEEEKTYPEIDICGIFSIGDTGHLGDLIRERDIILNNLETAETRYISSFRLSTPEPSVMELPVPPKDEKDIKNQISRPKALTAYTHHRSPRARRKLSSNSGTPTSYVAPSQYYKLRGVRGISSGRMYSENGDEKGGSPGAAPTFGETVRSRIVGSRFQEVNRDSTAFGRLPIGSRMTIDRGELGPWTPATESPPRLPYIPQHPLEEALTVEHTIEPSSATEVDTETSPLTGSIDPGPSRLSTRNEDYLHSPLYEESSQSHYRDSPMRMYDTGSDSTARPRGTGLSPEGAGLFARERQDPLPPPERRETFAMRRRSIEEQEREESQVPLHLRLQPQGPFVRPLSGLDHEDLGAVYADIREWRSRLKAINRDITDAQHDCYNDIADGARIKGWLVTGRGVRFLKGIQLIEGRSKEDIRWEELQNENGIERKVVFWTFAFMVGIILGAALIAVSGLAVATAPNVSHFIPFLSGLVNSNEKIGPGVATVFAAAVAATFFFVCSIVAIHYAAQHSGAISYTSIQLMIFKATFFILMIVGAMWFTAVGAAIFAVDAFDEGTDQSKTVANGSIYMSAFFLALTVNVAIIIPGLLLLQPGHLINVLKKEKTAVTPRQHFRAMIPNTYDPTYAMACCILAVILASTFSLIFPLIGPAVILLLFLTIIAHRFLVGYVYGRTEAPTGGLLQIWLLRRFATVIAFQPILLGLIYLTRRLWIEGGIMVGIGAVAVVIVEVYSNWRLKQPGRKSLSNVTQDALYTFEERVRPRNQPSSDDEGTSLVSSSQRARPRGSLASVLEMMSMTLAVMPTPHSGRHAVPLETEHLDDLTATERAARTHPDAPPHLPPLAFADHAEEMSGILYAPELIAPPPIIWLPNDSAGIARSEAYDLQRYHNLRTALDVRSTADVTPRRSSSSRKRTAVL